MLKNSRTFVLCLVAVAMTSATAQAVVTTLYEEDLSTSEIAECLGHSESGVRRIRQRFRERATLEPLKRGTGRKPKMTESDDQRRDALVRSQPDATLRELRGSLGVEVSLSTIDRHLRGLKLTFKKK